MNQNNLNNLNNKNNLSVIPKRANINNFTTENQDSIINRFIVKNTNNASSEMCDNNIIITDIDKDKVFNENKKLIKNIMIPEKIISELENPNLCVICFNSDTTKDPSIRFQCNHIFCLNCVKTYLEKNIQNGKVNIVLIRFLI